MKNQTEINNALARRFVEAMDQHDIQALLATVAPDLVNHAAVPEAQGAAGLEIVMGKLFEAFPDARYECQDVIADGDRVVCRVRMTGTHTGTLGFPRLPLPATGKRVETESIHVLRVEDGRVVEHWGGRDDIGMLRQLGQLERLGQLEEARAAS